MKYKRVYILFFLFMYFFSFPQKSNTLQKAEELSLQNPSQALRITKNIYQKGNFSQKEKLRVIYLLSYTSAITQNALDALNYGEIGLIEAEKQKDTLMQLKLLSNLGNVFQSFQLNEKTKEFLDRAEYLINKSGSLKGGEYIKGNIYYLQAMNYAYSLDSEIALSYFDKAIIQYTKSKQPIAVVNLKLAYLNKAFCLLNLKQFKAAQHFFNLSKVQINDHSKSYPAMFLKRHEIYIRLGECKIDTELNNSAKAIRELLNMLTYDNQIETLGIKADIFELLSENFIKTRNLQQSEYYRALHQSEIQLQEKRIAKMQNEFMRNEKISQDVLYKKIKINYMVFGAFIGLFFIVIILYYLIKIRTSAAKTEYLKKDILNHF